MLPVVDVLECPSWPLTSLISLPSAINNVAEARLVTRYISAVPFASILADAGEDPETLRALLGHSRTSTTMDLYCHANDKGKRRAITRLAEFIRG